MPAICKRVAMAFSVLALSLLSSSLFMSAAFAEGSSSNDEWSQPDNIFDSCEWKWDASTNTFKIRPCADAETGKLEYELPWKNYSNRVEVIEFEGPIATSLCGSLFEHCGNLREIKGFSNLDTSNATNMSWMFAYCDSLESVDLFNLNTSNVIDMSGMFVGCRSLKAIDVSSFDTSKVKSFGRLGQSGMFRGCQSLESIDVSGFDTSSAKSMDYMFSRCFSLKSLDLSNFDASSVTTMNNMFSESSSLVSINLSGINTSKVENMSGMFSRCLSLASIDLSSLDTSSAVSMSFMFNECKSLGSVDLSKFNTCNVTEFDHMFRGCESLESLNISTLETNKAKNMTRMFSNCHSLKSLDLSTFDTSNATDILGMFSGCSSIKSLDLSNFDTSKVEDMYGLFQDCFSLTTINISNFKISESCRLEEMFNGCRSLNYLDLSNFDSTEFDTIAVPIDYEIFQDASDSPKYKIQIGPKFTLQPYLTMGYWVDAINGTWYEEYAVPCGISDTYETYEYKGGIKSINFGSNPCMLTIGETITLPVTFVEREKAGGYDVIWTSSNPAVVKINTDAPFVYPLKPGKATITATVVQSGEKYSCDVVVNEQFWQSQPSQDSIKPYPASSAPVTPLLERVSISKLLKEKKGFTIKLSKPSSKYLKQITGYKIRYSTSKLMKKPKTRTVKASSPNGKKRTLKITKLKAKKKYYVQAATYRKISGKVYCSQWSKIKSVRAK